MNGETGGVEGGGVGFEVFEGGEVDGGVGEHAEEAEGEAAVEGPEAGGGVHFAEGGEDEEVARGAGGGGLALHAAVGEEC